MRSIRKKFSVNCEWLWSGILVELGALLRFLIPSFAKGAILKEFRSWRDVRSSYDSSILSKSRSFANAGAVALFQTSIFLVVFFISHGC